MYSRDFEFVNKRIVVKPEESIVGREYDNLEVDFTKNSVIKIIEDPTSFIHWLENDVLKGFRNNKFGKIRGRSVKKNTKRI